MGRRKVIEDQDLIAAARAVFIEKGALGTTKDVARRAGVSEAVIFQRFPTKAALFLAAMMPPPTDVSGIVVREGPDHKRDLVETGARMLAYFRTLIPAVMHLVTYPQINMSDVIAHQNAMPANELTMSLTAHLSELHRRGAVNAPKPMASAALFVAAIHSLAIYELMELHGGEPMDHAVGQFVDAMWAGLGPPT